MPTPHTAVTNMIYALDWVVDRIIEEGIENRQERFRAAGKRLEEELSEFGFKPPCELKDALREYIEWYQNGQR